MMFLFITMCVVLFYRATGTPDSGVVNGTAAWPGQFPYVVSLRQGTNHICSGTILDEYWVVTAADCAIEKQNMTIEAGTIKLRDKKGVIRSVEKINIHQYYGPSQSSKHDIAILKEHVISIRQRFLANTGIITAAKCGSVVNIHANDYSMCELQVPLLFDYYISPITLPEGRTEIPKDSEVFMYGWGVSEADNKTTVLQYIEMLEIPFYECKKTDPYGDYGQPNHICVRRPMGSEEQCIDDRGGPMVLNGLLVGVIPDKICVNAERPEVLTTIYPYLEKMTAQTYHTALSSSGDTICYSTIIHTSITIVNIVTLLKV